MTRFAIVALILFSASSTAQTDSTPQTGAAPVAGTSQNATQGVSVSCASTPGQRTQCPANTSSGVALLRSTGPGQCLLGNTWGYDQTGIWVTDGCSGEFMLGQPPVPDTAKQTPSYQAAFFPLKKRLEVYGVTSRIFGDKAAGFGNGREFTVGGNYYWFDNRNVRSNVQVMNIDRSPVSSVFGFYVGGQKGTTVSAATSFYF